MMRGIEGALLAVGGAALGFALAVVYGRWWTGVICQ